MKRTLLALLGLTAVSTAAYATFVEPNRLDLHEEAFTLPRMAKAFDGYRITQISDFHLGSPVARRRLQTAIQRVNESKPDLIAITGDMVDGYVSGDLDTLAEALCQLHAPDGVVAVLGNHDYRRGADAVRQTLRDCQVIELSNAVYSLEREGEQLHIAGLDSAVWRQDLIDTILDHLPEAGAAVLLAHEPDMADFSAATGRFDLQLSGHTHGGQIRLPLIGTPVLPSYGRRYPSGRYQVDNMILYTNRGLGTSIPPLRFGVVPEITLITLKTPA